MPITPEVDSSRSHATPVASALDAATNVLPCASARAGDRNDYLDPADPPAGQERQPKDAKRTSQRAGLDPEFARERPSRCISEGPGGGP